MKGYVNKAAVTHFGRRMTDKFKPLMSYKPCDGFYSPEEILRANTKAGIRSMLETLSSEEQTQLCFLPLVYGRIAWLTADKVLQICVQNRISYTKKQVRKIKELYKDYMATIRLDLEEDAVQRVIVAADDVIEQSGMTYAHTLCRHRSRRSSPWTAS